MHLLPYFASMNAGSFSQIRFIVFLRVSFLGLSANGKGSAAVSRHCLPTTHPSLTVTNNGGGAGDYRNNNPV